MRSLANAFGSRSSAIFGACGALGARGAGPAPRAAARRQGRSLPAPAGPRADAQPSPSCLVPSFRSLAAHASTSAMADRPLRVLAFHGYLQTGQTFRERTGPLRRALKNKVEFIFLDGPFKALSTDEVLQRPDGKRIEGKGDEVVEGKGWWTYERAAGDTSPLLGHPDSRAAVGADGSPVTSSPQFVATGWRESLEFVRSQMEAHAPIDGLVGFSQGSALCTLYAAESRRHAGWPRVKFLMLFASFLPVDVAQRAALLEEVDGTKAVDVPTLLFYGARDAITSPESAKGLRLCCSQLEEHEHEGGHSVPNLKAKSTEKQDILDFVAKLRA